MNNSEIDCGPILEIILFAMPTRFNQVGVYLYICFCLAFIITAVLGNILIISAIIRVRILHKRHNVYIISLAVADLGVALIVMPMQLYIFWSEHWYLPLWLCTFRNVCDVSLTAVSVFSLISVVVDRYLAICYPFIYSKLSNILIGIVIALCWIIPLSLYAGYFAGGWNVIGGYYEIEFCLLYVQKVCPFIMSPHSPYIAFTLMVYIPFILMCFMYIQIYRTAKRHFRAIQALNITEESRKKEKAFVANTTAVITLAILVGCFFICWLPATLTLIIDNATGFTLVSYDVIRVVSWLAYLNSMMNPILVYIFSQEFKVAFKTVLRCKRDPVNN